MKLKIIANDNEVKVRFNGDTKSGFAALLTVAYRLMKSAANNEQGFEDAKRILSSGIKATNYDGTTDNELYQRLLNDEH